MPSGIDVEPCGSEAPPFAHVSIDTDMSSSGELLIKELEEERNTAATGKLDMDEGVEVVLDDEGGAKVVASAAAADRKTSTSSHHQNVFRNHSQAVRPRAMRAPSGPPMMPPHPHPPHHHHPPHPHNHNHYPPPHPPPPPPHYLYGHHGSGSWGYGPPPPPPPPPHMDPYHRGGHPPPPQHPLAPYPVPSYPASSSGSFDEQGSYHHPYHPHPNSTPHYSPHVQYPGAGGHPYHPHRYPGGEEVNVISPNHKNDPQYRPPHIPPRPRGAGAQASGSSSNYYQYPPTSPVSRPGQHSPPRLRSYASTAAVRRIGSSDEGTYARAPDEGRWHGYGLPSSSSGGPSSASPPTTISGTSMRGGKSGSAAVAASSRPHPPVVAESFDSAGGVGAAAAYHSSSMPNTPMSIASNNTNNKPPQSHHAAPPPASDPHMQFYGGGGSWGSFDSAAVAGPPPPHFDDHRYYGLPPPDSPYSSALYPQQQQQQSLYSSPGPIYTADSFASPHHPAYGPPPMLPPAFSYSYDDEERQLQDYHPDQDGDPHHKYVTPPGALKKHRSKSSTPISSNISSRHSLMPKAADEINFDVVDPPLEPIVPENNLDAVCDSVTEVNLYDVLCGRGGGTNSQIGNRRFRQLVQEFQPIYLMAKRKEKPLLARTIVLIIRKRGGRFLKKNEESGELFEVGDMKAEAKTSQALREGLDVRATKSAASASSKKDKNSGKISSLTDSPESPQDDSPVPSQKQNAAHQHRRDNAESPPNLPRLHGEEDDDEEDDHRRAANGVEVGVVHPHSPEPDQYRKRRRVRSADHRFFSDFMPPRADISRELGDDEDEEDAHTADGEIVRALADEDDDINSTPIRRNGTRDEMEDYQDCGVGGCAGIALDIVTGAAKASFCLGPSGWRR